ncbi:IclR family transcriptional regulator [Cupriavidus sp. CuC1]|uniref:IclR family transcriptional regulator n=1 Tax=Cupriavidus sp. CuC1 TaxID=3373131 RepID=UPI0037D184CC
MSQQNAAPARKRTAPASTAAPAAKPKPKVRAATNAMANAVTVKPVSNAIRILRYLTQTGAPERAADIARHLSINSSTCFNILRTLVAEDVVDFNALSKTYSAGLGLARLVEQLVTQGQRLQLAAPPMQDLAAEFGVTVTLWRRLGADRIVLVSSQSSPTNLRIDMPAGQRLPILMGASGRLFAGRLGLTEEQLREEFEQLRWVRTISFDNYLREVNRARRRGWASDDGYFATGVLAIAAPVCDPSGNIAFTVSTVMIRGDRSEDKVEALGEAVRDLGHNLESVLF